MDVISFIITNVKTFSLVGIAILFLLYAYVLQPMLKLPRLGGSILKIGTIAGAVLLVMGLFSSGIIGGGSSLSVTSTGSAATAAPATYQQLCPSAATANYQFRNKDKLQTTNTWIGSSNVYVIGQNVILNTTTVSSGTGYSANVVLPCGTAGYNAYLLSDNTTVGAASQSVNGGAAISQQPGYLTFESVDESPSFQVRVKDVQADNYFYGGDAGRGFTDADRTYNETGTAGTLIDAGTGGFWNLQLLYAANQTTSGVGVTQCGLAVDLNPSSWEKLQSVTLDGTTTITEAKDTSLTDNDKTALSAYEYFFPLPEGLVFRGTTTHTINAYIKATSSSVDPAAADDAIFRMICKGYFLSSKNSNTVLYDYFQDDSARTQVSTQKDAITIDEVA